ncbi:MAG: hypothetical protein ACODAJ_05880, partial [Planctomycetota bacterium]
KVLDGAASDPAVVVRAIATDAHGTFLAIANTALTPKPAVTIQLPADGTVTDAATGQPLQANRGRLRLDLPPCSLRAIRVR